MLADRFILFFKTFKMNISTQNRIDDFNRGITGIQVSFDAYFLKGKLEDYYQLNMDEESGMLTILFTENNELPKQIKEELISAFEKAIA